MTHNDEPTEHGTRMAFYLLKIKAPSGDFLKFRVAEYELVDEGLTIQFTDRYTGKVLLFPYASVTMEKLEGELD